MPDLFDRETLIVALSFAGVFFVLLAIFLPFLSRDKRQERVKMLTQHREILSEKMRADMSQKRREKRYII